MAEFDPFNAKPTEWAENLFRSAMRDAYGALNSGDSEKAYRDSIARALAGICEGLHSVSTGLRATYLEVHKVNQKLTQIERSREKERFRKA